MPVAARRAGRHPSERAPGEAGRQILFADLQRTEDRPDVREERSRAGTSLGATHLRFDLVRDAFQFSRVSRCRRHLHFLLRSPDEAGSALSADADGRYGEIRSRSFHDRKSSGTGHHSLGPGRDELNADERTAFDLESQPRRCHGASVRETASPWGPSTITEGRSTEVSVRV